MKKNDKTLMNPQTVTTLSTDDTRPIVVPKISLSNTAPQGVPTASNGAPAKSSKLGLVYSILGFVLGILSMVAVIILGFFAIPMSVVGFAALIPYGIGIVMSIVGIVFSSMGRNMNDTSGLAKAGMVMNIIPLAVIAALITITFVGCAALASCFAAMVSQA